MEQPAEYYDAVARNPKYAATYRGHYTLYRKWFPLLLLVADRMCNDKNRKILDLGCGAGHLAHLMYDLGFTSYLGVDFSEGMLEIARGRGLPDGFEFRHGDLKDPEVLYNIALNDGYDIVVSTEFVEHVEDDLAILARLQPRTRCLITTTNEPGKEHVRTFPTEMHVRDRYDSLFQHIAVTTFRNMLCNWGWQQFYLIDGILN